MKACLPPRRHEGPAADRSEAGPSGAEGAPALDEAGSGKSDTATFDFDGFGGGLVKEDEDEEEEEGPAPPAAPAASAEGGLELEGVLAASYDFSGSVPGAVSGERIETERPLGELEGEAAYEWARTDEPAAEGDQLEAPTAPRRPAARLPGEGRGGPPPRARPEAAPQKESAGIPTALVALLVLVVLGGGGWFGWRALQSRSAADGAVAEEEVDPPVTILDIPAALEPRTREVAALALADWVIAVRDTLPAQRGIALEPDQAWLGSQYMADASRFGSVAAYWRELDAYVDRVLAEEQEIYESFLEARLVDSTGVADPDAELIAERAAAGFQANRPERRTVYRQLRAVIDAATGLHEFLVENEDRIDYQPGPERDSVLDAVPESSQLGDEMWGRVDSITTALDRLGALDKVTTERLLALATAKFEAIGVR